MTDRFHHLFISPSNLEKSLAFYRDTLGWKVVRKWGGNGAGRGFVLSGGGIEVVLAENEGSSGGTAPTVHIDVHDLDARFKSLPKGTQVVTKPEATHWGTRWFVVRDPDGNLIAFEEIRPRGG